MKKALSLLLAIAMLASLCTVPAWAEEDASMDFPVIEEITEEELEEEFELFGEEMELYESTVALQKFELAEDDGLTYLTELPDAKISYYHTGTVSIEGTLASLRNGRYTTGVWNGANTDANNVWYKDGTGAIEGFMGTKASTQLVLDLGEAKTFSGFRVYNSVRGRSLSARNIKTVDIYLSNNGVKWHKLDASSRAPKETFGDLFTISGGTAVNVTARYVRLNVTAVDGWGQYELEELILLDADPAKETKVMDVDIKVNQGMVSTFYAEEKAGATMLSASTATVKSVGGAVANDTTTVTDRAALMDGSRSNGMEWSLGTSTPAGKYLEIALNNATAFSGVRVWMRGDTASWANGYYSSGEAQFGNVRRIPTEVLIKVSDDGVLWEELGAPINLNETYWYFDMPFTISGEQKNFTAKYIRIYPKKIKDNWGEWTAGEIALLNVNNELDTYESVKEISDEVEVRYDYYRASKFFTYKSGGGTPVEYNGYTYTNTADWNGPENLFDGVLTGAHYHTAANIPVNNDGKAPYVPLPAELRTITITFNEASPIGGFRVYPRTDNTAGNPHRVNIYASNDGENYTEIRHLATGFSNADKAPKEFLVEKNLSAYKHYKFEVYSTSGSGSTTAHCCYSELQVLKPRDFGAALTEGDFTPYPIGKINGYTVAKDGTATLYRGESDHWIATDGIILNDAILADIAANGGNQYAYCITHDSKIWGCMGNATPPDKTVPAESAYLVYDLGSVQEFAGVRLYARTGQLRQQFKDGVVSVSEDGINWVPADAITTTGPVVNDLALKFNGTAYNAKARYVKIHCLATASGHWSFEEVRLLNANEDNETKTPSEIITVMESMVSEVEALIAAIGEVTVDSEEAIVAAREAYSALPDALKAKVKNLSVLEEAEEAFFGSLAAALNAKIAAIKPYNVTADDADAIAELVAEYEALNEETKAFIIGLDDLKAALSGLSETVNYSVMERTETSKGGAMGYQVIDYTLYVSANDVEVTGVTYEGEEVANTYGEWSFVNNGDGTMTFTLGGNYYANPATRKWLYDGSTLASIRSHTKGGAYYTLKNGISSLGLAAGAELTENTFHGFYPRLVTAKRMGDHVFTLTLSDGTTKDIVLREIFNWKTVNVTSAYDDDIDVASIKVASNNVVSEGDYGRLFDGNLTNATNSQTITSIYKTSETDSGTNQHIVYAPGPLSVWVDFGKATTIGGIRAIDKSSNLNDVSVYGSNNLENWTLIGEIKGNASKTAEVWFDNNETYRYVQVKFDKYRDGNPYYLFIHEIAFLKAKTRLTSASEVPFDVSESGAATFNVTLEGSETLTSIKDASGNDAVYTFENGVIAIDSDYLAELPDAKYAFTATFSNEATVTFTVDKRDTSKATYVLADAEGRGSENLVLTSLSGKAVKNVAIKDGNVALEFTTSEDNKTITVERRALRGAYNLFTTMNVETDGILEVVATYEDDTTKSYYVIITSTWLATGTPAAEFLEDEIVPAAGAWKARVSSASSASNNGVDALYMAAANKKDTQHWHSCFGGEGNKPDQALDHFFEVDFGANAPTYNGIRIRERVEGSGYKKITVYGKNTDADEWDVLCEATPEATTINTIYFEKAVNYRYMRVQIDGKSDHVTVDTLHILKAVAVLTSNETVIVDTNRAEEAIFKFALVDGAENALVVKMGDVVVEAENYTFENGVLTFSEEFTEALPEGEIAIAAVIDGYEIAIKINKRDKYTVTYAITSITGNAEGDNSLVLSVPAGETVTGVKYNGADVTYTATEFDITITRSAFRRLDDMFDMDSLKLSVSFESGEVMDYNVVLSNDEFTVTGVNADAFAEDEIVPADGAWKVLASSVRDSGGTASAMLAKSATGANAWHTGYEVVNGNAISDSAFGRNYLEIDFGAETKFAGIRYHARTEEKQTAGIWRGVAIYGRNNEAEDWTLIKSQGFDATTIAKERVATIYFGEDVSYKEVRMVITCDGHATGKALAFLEEGTLAPAPEVPEEEEVVNIKVTPTTGGNVIVNEAPTLGDNYVASNTEVTFTASSNAGSTFQYWIEANTGRILGADEVLTVKSAVGKDIKAVFADPSAAEAFISFYGRNAKNIISTSYVKKGQAPKAPANDKLYTTGYAFIKWVDAEGNDLDITEAVNANTAFYAYYEAKVDEAKKESTITVEGGMIKAVVDGTYAEEGTFAYDTYVVAKANEAENGFKFSHWEIDGKIVSYLSTYKFYAPDADIDLVAVFVAGDAVVEKTISAVITETQDTVNGIDVAGFITTRNIPEGYEVIECGTIYVKDASFVGSGEDGALTIADAGKTAPNGKAVKVAFASGTASGQHKLSASYYEDGIKAVGFITYEKDGVVDTVYTDTLTVTK